MDTCKLKFIQMLFISTSRFLVKMATTKREVGWQHLALPMVFITGTSDECAYFIWDGRKKAVTELALIFSSLSVFVPFSLPLHLFLPN